MTRCTKTKSYFQHKANHIAEEWLYANYYTSHTEAPSAMQQLLTWCCWNTFNETEYWALLNIFYQKKCFMVLKCAHENKIGKILVHWTNTFLDLLFIKCYSIAVTEMQRTFWPLRNKISIFIWDNDL